jgi:hypothetical protein
MQRAFRVPAENNKGEGKRIGDAPAIPLLVEISAATI